MQRRKFVQGAAALAAGAAGLRPGRGPAATDPAPVPSGPQPPASALPHPSAAPERFTIAHTDAGWRALLTPGQYFILRQGGTERPYTSPLLKEHRAGVFTCAGCGQPVFSSTTKYESNTGWPSFFAAVPGTVGTSEDRSENMVRTEVHCSRCGSHLGHVFEDGPPPTYLRYCMDGLALLFVPI